MARAAATAARLHAAGVAANADMRPAAAARMLRMALSQLDRGADVPQPGPLRGRILVSLALAESEQGHTSEGLRLLRQAESCLPMDQRGVLHGQRGMLLRRTGRDDLALEEYTEALSVLDEPVEIARVLLNRAVLHMAAARSGPAAADLRRCADLAACHGLESLAAKAEHNLGYLDYLAGDIPCALRRYAIVERSYTRHNPGMLPVLSLDRARALLAAGLFTEADQDLANAQSQLGRQRLSQDHAETQLARAEAAMLAGRAGAARRWARRAHALFVRRDNPRWAARAELVLLRAEHATGADVAARAVSLAGELRQLGLAEDARVASLIAVRALAASGEVARASPLIAMCSPRRADRLDTRLLWRLAQAEVASADGRPGAASRHLAAGLDELHRYRSRFGSLDLQTGASVHGQDLARHGLRAALDAGAPAAIFRWAERARAQALLMPPARPPDDPAAAGALEELRHVRTALRAAELAGRTGLATAALRARGEALQRTIAEHAWYAGSSGPHGRPSPLPAVRAELAGAAMVMYLRDGRLLYALVLTRRRAVLVPLGSAAKAREALLRLRADLDARAGRAMPARMALAVREATRRDAAALTAAILDPVLPLAGDRDLVVVPTDILVTVPWSALAGCAGRPVTVAPSATSWLAARRAMPRAGAVARALLVAGPGNDRGDAEVTAIASVLAGATVLTGSRASPKATLAAMSAADLAHLAAHGRHHPGNALFSELRLAGGSLMGYDLRHLRATPAMVILSSCDLGLHAIRPGDETLGMATALLSAGTSTVIASVSAVADESAMTTMVGYHSALRRGLSPAAALACATASGDAGFICFGAG
jgi:hypothetical protein